MLFEFAAISGKERYKLLVSTITPRPIAWVVSQDANGRLNAAPFSFFNAFVGVIEFVRTASMDLLMVADTIHLNSHTISPVAFPLFVGT